MRQSAPWRLRRRIVERKKSGNTISCPDKSISSKMNITCLCHLPLATLCLRIQMHQAVSTISIYLPAQDQTLVVSLRQKRRRGLGSDQTVDWTTSRPWAASRTGQGQAACLLSHSNRHTCTTLWTLVN